MHSIEQISKNRIKEIVKLHQKKFRDEQGIFIAEGFKILEELIETNADIIDIFALNSTDTTKIKRKITIVDENTMKKISTTDSPCEIITIARKKEQNINNFSNLKKLVLLDSISDPGNLGTIIRSATAFEIDGIILFGNCVDQYSPKVIRSTTGNLFKIPVINIKNEEEIKRFFSNHTKIATSLSKENNISLDDCAKIDKYIIMLGSEAKGLSENLVKLTDKNIRLEMSRNVESLNLSVSASIIFYELYIKII